jgi:RNA polymerase sigma-B factor
VSVAPPPAGPGTPAEPEAGVAEPAPPVSTRAARNARNRAEASGLLVELHLLPLDDPARAALRSRLVELHMPLVEHLARRFAGRNEPLPDLVQVGSIGLIKAVDRFEPERGLEFSTYATPTILGEIKRHFRDVGWLVRVPRRAQELQTTIARARADLSQELRRAPTVAELAKRIDAPIDDVIEALDASRAYAGLPLEALAEPGRDPSDNPIVGTIDERLEQVEQRALLRPILETLPERERQILLLRFVAGKTQTEIAAIVGVSQMQVSRLVARSLAQLRERLGGGERPT